MKRQRRQEYFSYIRIARYLIPFLATLASVTAAGTHHARLSVLYDDALHPPRARARCMDGGELPDPRWPKPDGQQRPDPNGILEIGTHGLPSMA